MPFANQTMNLGRFTSTATKLSAVLRTRTTAVAKLTHHHNTNFFTRLRSLSWTQSTSFTRAPTAEFTRGVSMTVTNTTTLKSWSLAFHHHKLGQIHFSNITRFYFLCPNLHSIKYQFIVTCPQHLPCLANPPQCDRRAQLSTVSFWAYSVCCCQVPLTSLHLAHFLSVDSESTNVLFHWTHTAIFS
jgi:hypothetical protein